MAASPDKIYYKSFGVSEEFQDMIVPEHFSFKGSNGADTNRKPFSIKDEIEYYFNSKSQYFFQSNTERNYVLTHNQLNNILKGAFILAALTCLFILGLNAG